jgi:cysteine synthase A
MNIIYNNILETVGNTPIVKLNKLAPEDVNVYVKVESFNPMGSVKDRLALSVIETAEKNGTLRPGQTVIEATSGNTGIRRHNGRELQRRAPPHDAFPGCKSRAHAC